MSMQQEMKVESCEDCQEEILAFVDCCCPMKKVRTLLPALVSVADLMVLVGQVKVPYHKNQRLSRFLVECAINPCH